MLLNLFKTSLKHFRACTPDPKESGSRGVAKIPHVNIIAKTCVKHCKGDIKIQNNFQHLQENHLFIDKILLKSDFLFVKTYFE